MNGPVPLGNEGSGMMIPLLIACCSSLSSSVGGFLMKDKIAAMLGGKKGVSTPMRTASRGGGGGVSAKLARARASQRRAAQQRASAARRRAAGARRRQMAARRRVAASRQRAARRRAAASRRRRAAGARKRMMAARRRRAARIARKMKRKMKRFRFGRRGRRMRRRFGRRGRKMRRRFRCFSPETSVKLHNGDTRPMKNLKLGDVLINGSIVEATLKIRNQNDPYYKLPGDILVTGSHYIKDGSTYKHVSKFSKAEATTQIDDVVCCLVTSDHKIPVGDFVFWDWEDNLVPNHVKQNTKVMTLRNRNKTLNTL
jgi:hypothetical protein